MILLRRFLGTLLSILLILVPIGIEASTQDITVYHNGTMIYFPDQAPIINSGSTLVPIRGVAESLGLDVEWDATSQMVILSRHDIRLELRIGNKGVVKQTRDLITTVYLDVAPAVYNGRVLIPLRGVSETIGANVEWDGTTRRIDISSEGIKQSKDIQVVNSIKGKALDMSNTPEEIKNKLGNPEDIIKGSEGNEVWVFYPNTMDHIQVGVNRTQVTSISTMAQNWSLMGIEVGQAVGDLKEHIDIRPKYGVSTEGYDPSFIKEVRLAHVQVTVYEDYRKGMKSASLLGFELTRGDFNMDVGRYSSDGAGKIMHYFINDVRINNGVSPLRWDSALHDAASYHSIDMYDNNYFSHDDSQGTFSDRMKRILPDRERRGGVGENIHQGVTSALESMASFLNSKGHYNNMVNIDFTDVGVSIYKGYVTQVFSGVRQSRY